MKITKFRIFNLFALLLILANQCTTDSIEISEYEYQGLFPEKLKMIEIVGIKLESNFATTEINMNVKLNTTGRYYIKVLTNSGKVVSKEQVKGELGDNLFTVYTSTLPKSSYRIELYLEDKKVGATSINLL
tara:strand:- start:78 stop:470 length:393 start_codon:yes stop_codon:yes gene_type:complete